MESKGQALVGDPEMELVANSEHELDEECLCGTAFPCAQSGTVPCCCCCRITCRRLPEAIFLGVIGFCAVAQFIAGRLFRLAFLVAIFTRACSGVLFSVLLFLYLPFTVIESCGACDRIKLGRFHRIALTVSAVCICLNLASLLPVWIEAQQLEDAISEEFGESDPPNPTLTSLSFIDWMFWLSGPYKSLRNEFQVETYIYLSSVERKPGWSESCSRPFLEKLALDVVFPNRNDDQPAPIIFFIHGGGFIQEDPPIGPFPYFVDRGYAMVSPQYALICDGFSAFEMLDQLTKAFDYLRANATKWGMDPNRIFIAGQSAGGHLALMLAYTLNSPVCGGWQSCGIKGVYNQYGVAVPIPLPTGERDLLLAHTLHGTEDPEQAKLAYPITHVTNSSPPTMSHHGTWDTMVPYYMSIDLHNALQSSGVREYLITLPTFEHGCEIGYYQGCSQLFRFAFERFLALRVI